MKKENILVVGGAGYIGSHMVKMLLDYGYRVVIFDNFSTGCRDAVLGGEFVLGDLADPSLLRALFANYDFSVVMHFAACTQVGESIVDPDKYYRNNVANTLNLLHAMIKRGVNKIVFSSSAAIFGEPQTDKVSESHRKSPVNPYGHSKWMIEQILTDYSRAYGMNAISLRYFNAASADPDGLLGERHQPETHLIPLVLQTALGKRSHVEIFGCDYDTPDRTCIRDFIHVIDLCQAHLLALKTLVGGAKTTAFNLGNGNGFSVREVVRVAETITGKTVAVRERPRREGDPARLVADASRANDVLSWSPRYPQLEKIVEHAWRWEQNLSRGNNRAL